MKFLNEMVEWSARLLNDESVRDFTIIGSASIEGYHDPKDLDFLVLMPPTDGNIVSTHRWHFGPEFTLPEGEYEETEDGHWCAIRKGNVNLILTTSQKWYNSCTLANEVVRGLRLTNKHDRKIVFRIIRDGADPEDARNTP